MENYCHPIFGKHFHHSICSEGQKIDLSKQKNSAGNVYSGMHFAETTFTGSAQRLSCPGSVFDDCQFNLSGKNACLRIMNLQHAVFYRCKFFLTGSIESCFLGHSQFIECVFEHIDGYACNFSNALFVNCEFADTSFRETVFEDATFQGCKFTECTLLNLAFDYSTFVGNSFQSCLFSARQALFSFGAKDLLNSEGILFSAGENELTGEELKRNLANHINLLREDEVYFPLINAKLILDKLDDVDVLLKEAFCKLSQLGLYRRIELLIHLMDYLPRELMSADLRAELFHILVNSASLDLPSMTGSAANHRLNAVTILPQIERLRQMLQVSYGNRLSVSIAIGSGGSEDDEKANERAFRNLINTLEVHGINYDSQSSKNSPVIHLVTLLVTTPEILSLIPCVLECIANDIVDIISSCPIDVSLIHDLYDSPNDLLNPLSIIRDIVVGAVGSKIGNNTSTTNSAEPARQILYIQANCHKNDTETDEGD